MRWRNWQRMWQITRSIRTKRYGRSRRGWNGMDDQDKMERVFGGRIDHIGIAVKSLAEARKIYDLLGLKVSAAEVVENEKVRVVMVEIGESRLELLEATSEESVIAKFVAKKGEGIHHVALKVEDLRAKVDELRRNGVRLVKNEIQVGAGGHKY